MKKIFFLFCLLANFIGVSSIYASHLWGREMYYQHLGGCDYRIYCKEYLDCSGAATQTFLPPSMSNPVPGCYFVDFYNEAGLNLSSINPIWILDTVVETTQLCPSISSSCYGGSFSNGVVAYTYFTDITLCGNSVYDSLVVRWQNCCRSYAIYNGGGGQSIYIELTIPLNINNNSPYFVTQPIIYVPAGQTSTFEQIAFDDDGDSLAYSFAPCYMNQGQTIPYNPGFSAFTPLGSSWLHSINNQTGEITFTPQPGNITNVTLGIKVEEFRNGTLIGSITRDLELHIINDPNTFPTATVTNINGVGFQNSNPPTILCTEANHTLSFDIIITDPDPGQVLSFTSNINTQFPTATLTANGNINPMILTFSWTPTIADKGKTYPLLIDTYDDNCNLIAHKYIHANIVVDSPYVTTNITDSDCVLPTGAIDLTVFGGFSPYTYSWNNGATTEDLTNIPNGVYAVTITDASGTIWNYSPFYVNAIGLSGYFNENTPDCNSTNGALGVDVSGGQGNYTYTWSNGMNGDSINNLAIGGYSVNVYDSVGCLLHIATMLNYDPADSCFSRITGTLYYDANGNCVQDIGEPGVANKYIDITPGGAMFTDTMGYYSFVVYDTGTYTLHAIIPATSYATSNCLPPNFTINSYIGALGIDSLHNDFPINFPPDLKVYLGEDPYYYGWGHFTYLACQNISYYLSNAVLTYQNDSALNLISVVGTGASYNTTTNTLTWNVTNFPPGTMRYYGFTSLATNMLPGDTVRSYGSISPIIGDISPLDNEDTTVRIILSSNIPVGTAFDPNFKEVSPQGATIHGLISPNTETLEYSIHFQNTGTWYATYVGIRDTIDVNALDITSIEMQIASHACNISIEQDSILVFTFNNINLPDSFTNESASHGFVKYGIKLKPNLPLYTTIQNSASIYFDFNEPVKTNTTLNTLYNPMNLSVITNTNICPEDSILAVVTEGRLPYQFAYSNGVQDNNNTSGQSQIPANFATGTHNVSVTDYYGLTTTQSFMLNALPLANAAFAYNPAGSNYFFTANSFNNATYLWDFGNGQTSTNPAATATYTQNGAYAVTLIVTDLCGGADTGTQTITLSVGLSPSLFQQQVNISPNPTADIVLLSFQNEARELYTLTISDVNGKVIKSILNIKEEKIIVHTNDMASGTYFWELKGKEMAMGVLLVE